MNTIQVQLTIEETNLILEALGGLPYVRVFELVHKIQTQAQQQLRTDGDAAQATNGKSTDKNIHHDQ